MQQVWPVDLGLDQQAQVQEEAVRCDVHCPPDAWFPVGAAVAVLAAAAAVGQLTGLMHDVVYWVLAGVWAVAVAAAWYVWRLVRRAALARPVFTVVSRLALESGKRVAITAAQRRALPAAGPVVQGVVLRDSERIGR